MGLPLSNVILDWHDSLVGLLGHTLSLGTTTGLLLSNVILDWHDSLVGFQALCYIQ